MKWQFHTHTHTTQGSFTLHAKPLLRCCCFLPLARLHRKVASVKTCSLNGSPAGSDQVDMSICKNKLILPVWKAGRSVSMVWESRGRVRKNPCSLSNPVIFFFLNEKVRICSFFWREETLSYVKIYISIKVKLEYAPAYRILSGKVTII